MPSIVTSPRSQPRRPKRRLTRRQGWLLAIGAFALIGLEALLKPLPVPQCPGPGPATADSEAADAATPNRPL